MKKEVRKIIASSKKAPTQKEKSQAELVFDYLKSKGKQGATNFEMMMRLRICDVRKRISELNELLWEYYIDSEYEESADGKRYKRYWLIPAACHSLAEFLHETKCVRNATSKRTGGGRR